VEWVSLSRLIRRRAWLGRLAWWLAGVVVWLAFAHGLLAQPLDAAGERGASADAQAAQAAQRAGQMQTLPLVQLDERTASADLDNRPLSLTFSQPASIKEVLLLLVRGTNLSIVPDPTIDGAFTGELKNVTVRQALDAILEPRGLGYLVDGTFIRVFRREPETRIFDINYIATERIGSTTVGAGDGRSTASISTATKTDIFSDLATGIRALLSERATFNVDRKAGLVQVTDFPDRLDRVSIYLDAVRDRVHRQAQIDVRVLEIELSDEKASGIDWAGAGTQTAPAGPASGPSARGRASRTSLRVGDLDRLLQMLDAQGTVTVIANPRLLTMNNEPAIVRTETVTLSVTPQISGDSQVTLSVSPLVKTPAVAESDMLARIADGETLVVSGFARDRETRERKAVGVSGGWFGRSTVVTRRRIELVILLTPRIVAGAAAQ
jgi:MSHA biogenesis protein MshL